MSYVITKRGETRPAAVVHGGRLFTTVASLRDDFQTEPQVVFCGSATHRREDGTDVQGITSELAPASDLPRFLRGFFQGIRTLDAGSYREREVSEEAALAAIADLGLTVEDGVLPGTVEGTEE